MENVQRLKETKKQKLEDELQTSIKVADAAKLLMNTFTRRLKADKKNKLCVWRHNMPPPRPLYSAHLQSIAYTPYACCTQPPCTINIHDRQAAARSARWRRSWSRRYIM